MKYHLWISVLFLNKEPGTSKQKICWRSTV